MQVLTDLKNRGLEDMQITSLDNLTCFLNAVSAIYPRTDVQLCVMYYIRNSKKYLAYMDTLRA